MLKKGGSQVNFMVGEQVLALWQDGKDDSGESNTAFYRGVVVQLWDTKLTIQFVNEEDGDQLVCTQEVSILQVVRDCTEELCTAEGASVDVFWTSSTS
jgi:hypothetical protein